MDYLPIQASAVPCERVFSSSAATDTKKRNRLSPLLMEALQMLKFSLKKTRLNFTAGWVTSQHLLLEDEPEEPGEGCAADKPVTTDATGDSVEDVIRLLNEQELGDAADHVDLIS
jgi:hypothetical protein